MKVFTLLVICLALIACEQKLTADEIIKNSIGNISITDTLTTFQAFAECQSPEGNYATEIHSGKDDYTYFKQVYSYRDEPFVAVVHTLDSGFQINPDSTFTSLSRNTIYALKSHEFHEILFDLSNRFHQFKEPELIVEQNEKLYRVDALDALSNPIELFFDQDTGLLHGLTMRNPDNMEEIIRVTYSNPKQIQGMLLPMHVGILQGDKQYIFDYTHVKINGEDFRRWGNN